MMIVDMMMPGRTDSKSSARPEIRKRDIPVGITARAAKRARGPKARKAGATTNGQGIHAPREICAASRLLPHGGSVIQLARWRDDASRHAAERWTRFSHRKRQTSAE